MSREEQVSATRDALLTAAERLFAERGVHAVANSQISEAAGQRNNAAVAYHFGTKGDVIRAIARIHAEQMERNRSRMIAALDDSAGLRDWVACMVLPVTDHLESLSSPTWYARFMAQVTADPALHAILFEESLVRSPSLDELAEGLNRCTPGMPTRVQLERALMARHLIVQMSVELERALADGTPAYRTDWSDAAAGLIDAIVALWQAPFAREA
ncbi:TetR family transcriptional regulator [Streptomyces sp. NPDC046862]|uniref:TetR/AcrR family transcriptional regulator n=1 Tax=Streptomyces sp. NPDC046862 TaxID=3154603 RepID=UPI0034514F46